MADILDRLRGNGKPWTFAEVIVEIERLRVALEDVPRAIRIGAASSPYSDGMTPAFNRGLSDGYEAAAQIAEHMARAALGEKA